MARPPTLLLLLLVSALYVAQLPAFRIGGTLSQCGRGAEVSTAMWDALKFYENYTNANGGIMVNGTQHQLELILYNDAFDPKLVELLYERLVNIDKVHALLSPLTVAVPAFTVARKYGIPLMNIGDVTYYTTGAPNGTWGGWVFSSVPNSLAYIDQCFAIMKGYDLSVVSSAWVEDVGILGFDLLNTLSAIRFNFYLFPQSYIPINDTVNAVRKVVSEMKEQSAEIFSGGMLIDSDNLVLLNEMREQQYNPKAIIFCPVPPAALLSLLVFESFRKAAGWEAQRLFGASFWDSSLNFTDAQFGNSIEFAKLYTAAYKPPEATTALAIFGAMSLKLAAEKVDALDPYSLAQGLLSLNEETFFGRANYSFPLQQTQGEYYCFQVDDNGDLYPVSPNAPTRKPVLWPALATAPPNFYHSSSRNNGKWIGLGVGLGGGLLLIAIISTGLYIYKVKYSVLFIPKKSEGKDGEW